MPAHANPCPTSEEWYDGLQHNHLLPTFEGHLIVGQLWEPVRAIASYKLYCLKMLVEALYSQPLAGLASLWRTFSKAD